MVAREKVLLWGQGGTFEAMTAEWTERCREREKGGRLCSWPEERAFSGGRIRLFHSVAF